MAPRPTKDANLGLPIVRTLFTTWLYLQQDRAGRAAASDFHETATSLRHITPFRAFVPSSFWVRCRL